MLANLWQSSSQFADFMTLFSTCAAVTLHFTFYDYSVIVTCGHSGHHSAKVLTVGAAPAEKSSSTQEFVFFFSTRTCTSRLQMHCKVQQKASTVIHFHARLESITFHAALPCKCELLRAVLCLWLDNTTVSFSFFFFFSWLSQCVDVSVP